MRLIVRDTVAIDSFVRLAIRGDRRVHDSRPRKLVRSPEQNLVETGVGCDRDMEFVNSRGILAGPQVAEKSSFSANATIAEFPAAS